MMEERGLWEWDSWFTREENLERFQNIIKSLIDSRIEQLEHNKKIYAGRASEIHETAAYHDGAINALKNIRCQICEEGKE